MYLSVYPRTLSHALWNATQCCHSHFYEFTVATWNLWSLVYTFFPPCDIKLENPDEWIWLLQCYWQDVLTKCHSVFYFHLCPALLGERIEALVGLLQLLTVSLRSLLSTCNFETLLCEAEEAFLSFLSFKCQLASEWPRGLPSSTLHNLLSVCKVLRGTCQNLTRPQSGGVIVIFFSVLSKLFVFFLLVLLA